MVKRSFDKKPKRKSAKKSNWDLWAEADDFGLTSVVRGRHEEKMDWIWRLSIIFN